MDIWHPGITHRDSGTSKIKLTQGKNKTTLTSLCTTTGFATTAFLPEVNSEVVTRHFFSHLCVPNGMPKLILIDQGSEFKGVLIRFCENLGVRYHVASPEDHNAILCERFHRYLNKVERLMAADMNTFEEWAMNVLFATYAWNASPIDGTDVTRSFAAKARTFRYPLDVQEDNNVIRIPTGEGESALAHVETMFPLWFQQKELLKILNNERRERHRKLKNQTRQERKFNPGELVIVRKQVRSKASEGRPEKLVLKPKGPYRVLEKAGEGSYWVQKIPVLQGINRRKGKRQKEAAMRMEKIPSSLVIHKRIDTMDTRFAKMKRDLIDNPLEQNLGFFDFGKYHQAAEDADYGFVRVNEMWNEPIETDSSSGDETEDDDTDEGDDTTPESDPEQPEEQEAVAETQQETHNVKKSIERDAKRKRTSAGDTQAKQKKKKVKITTPQTDKELLKILWKDVHKSPDKLFFIRRHETGRDLAKWHVVQVDEEATDRRNAKRYGEYHVRYYLKNDTDAKRKKTRECQFWPLLRELLRDGYLGAIIQVKPNRVEKFLNDQPSKYVWYQDTINLADVMIAGPFEFSKKQQHNIPEATWKELLDKAEEYRVDATNVNRTIPLPKHKRLPTRPNENDRFPRNTKTQRLPPTLT
jgi:hypothetical protein